MIAPKEDGSFWWCSDYPCINQQTDVLPYHMPRIENIIDEAEAGGCKIVYRIDFCKGFWQVPLEEEHKRYTAFIALFEVYEYTTDSHSVGRILRLGTRK